MDSTAISPIAWWGARRLPYNIGLVVAGILAFIAYAIACSTLLPEDADVEITPFAILLQGVGFLLMIGVANVFYSVGPLSERIVRPEDPERYRHICYLLGFWFSVLLPFSIPALLTVLALFDPSYWRPSR
jgi:peptidoglycan/LPS O-acetylase OafA/YrhL